MLLNAYVAAANAVHTRLRPLAADEAGQSMIEYGLLAALIAVAVVAVITLLGGKLTTVFQNIANNL